MYNSKFLLRYLKQKFSSVFHFTDVHAYTHVHPKNSPIEITFLTEFNIKNNFLTSSTEEL